MHRFMDASCSNCNKFSHCCNNDLICISKYREKEQECEKLKEYLNQAKYLTEGALRLCSERQNIKYKQALDEIEKISNKQRKFDLTGKTSLIPVINEVGEDFIDILDIINKTKDGK